MKSILASLTGTGNDHWALEQSRILAERFSAHVTCLFVRPDFPAAEDLMASNIFVRRKLLAQQLRDIEHDAELRETKAHDAFTAFCQQHSAAAAFEWASTAGDDVAETTEQARYFDMVVLGRQAVHDVVEVNRAGSIALGCGRPVLVAPPVIGKTIGDTIVIAWKNTPEAARAVTAAGPFLGRAKRIVVVTVCERSLEEAYAKDSGERLAAQMKQSGYPVEARHVPHDGHPASLSLLNAAYGCEADLLVMGAYGHSRMSEMVFGGVTRDLTNEAALPILMFH